MMDNSSNGTEKKKLYDRIKDTLSGLYNEPEAVIDSYVSGQRGIYLNPWLFLGVSALVLAFIATFVITFPEFEATPADPDQMEQLEEELEGFRMDEIQQVMQVVGVMLNTQFIGFMNFLLFPLLALVGMFFFRDTHPGFFRHMVLNTYGLGMANVAMLLLVPVWGIFNEQLFEPGIHLYPAAFIIGLTLLLTYRRYLGLTELKDWLKASSTLIVGYFAYSIISGFVIAMIAFIVYMAAAISASGL